MKYSGGSRELCVQWESSGAAGAPAWAGRTWLGGTEGAGGTLLGGG